MSTVTHRTYKKKSLAACREMSAAKKAAGISRIASKCNSQAEQGFARQITIMPKDTRSTTGFVLGDPIPGDPRCSWRPSSQHAGASS